MSGYSSPETASSSEDDDSPADALGTTSGESTARTAPSKRGVKLPKQKKRKSATEPPLPVLPENQAEVNEEPPFVPKLKALATNLNDYKKAVSAYCKADLKSQSAETDTEASQAKRECAAMLHKIRYIESVVKSGQFKPFDPVKSKSASAKSVANRKKRSESK